MTQMAYPILSQWIEYERIRSLVALASKPHDSTLIGFAVPLQYRFFLRYKARIQHSYPYRPSRIVP